MATPSPVVAYVALGSNLGDRHGHLAAAFAALEKLPGTRLVARSGLYETAPVGPPGQQDYLNAAAELSTTLEPIELLDHLLSIEQTRGRVRRERWGPRTLDLDLLLHGDQRSSDPRLTLPHPAMMTRAFVLAPLCDLSPLLVLDGTTVAARLESLDRSGIRQIAS